MYEFSSYHSYKHEEFFWDESTGVSEKHITSIFRVEEYDKKQT
jgi:hypothetical protein